MHLNDFVLNYYIDYRDMWYVKPKNECTYITYNTYNNPINFLIDFLISHFYTLIDINYVLIKSGHRSFL